MLLLCGVVWPSARHRTVGSGLCACVFLWYYTMLCDLGENPSLSVPVSPSCWTHRDVGMSEHSRWWCLSGTLILYLCK